MIDFDSIPISSVLDYVYCKRRWYLHSIEHEQESNIYIELGSIEHEYVDECHLNITNGVLTATNVAVYSNEYSLAGICDMVEFHEKFDGVRVPYCDYTVEIVPVEYKHGKVRSCNEYIAQVVAQAICLEEMYDCKIEKGYIYFVDADERYEVEITDKYRKMVFDAVDFIKNYNFENIKPEYSRKCKGCSVFDVCCPREINIRDYMDILWRCDDICTI